MDPVALATAWDHLDVNEEHGSAEPTESPVLYGWFTVDRNGERHFFGGGSPTPFPVPPRPEKPVRLRLMTDDMSGIALWLDSRWNFPESPVAYLFTDDHPEDVLPISPGRQCCVKASGAGDAGRSPVRGLQSHRSPAVARRP